MFIDRMFVANRYSIVELSYPHVKYKIVQHLTPSLLLYASSLSLISTEYHTQTDNMVLQQPTTVMVQQPTTVMARQPIMDMVQQPITVMGKCIQFVFVHLSPSCC